MRFVVFDSEAIEKVQIYLKKFSCFYCDAGNKQIMELVWHWQGKGGLG